MTAEGAEPGRTHAERRQTDPRPHKHQSTATVILIFGAAALVTLVAGVIIERASDTLAGVPA